MSLFSVKESYEYFTNDKMIESLKRLEVFDIYHCLLKGSLSSSIKAVSYLKYAPQGYLIWEKCCDGGLLFDTVLLSTKSHDKELDLDFDSFEDCNSQTFRDDANLDERFSVFAIRSYGDPLCFDKVAKDGRVYLWNREDKCVEVIWDTFEDWLADEIDSAIRLIADGALEPLEIKLNGGGNDV